MLHKIRAKHNQCLYDRFEAGDYATFELFIVDSDVHGRPEAAVQIEGPVAGAYIGVVDDQGVRSWEEEKVTATADGRTVKRKTTLGGLIRESAEKWPKYLAENHRRYQEEGIIHHAFHIDYTHSGESEDAVAARADVWRRAAQEAERDDAGDERAGPEETYVDEGNAIGQVIPETVAPYGWTKHIKTAGWYRMCVQAEQSISVEMDIRSGGMDRQTGHVVTHDRMEELREDARLVDLRNREPSAEEAEVARSLQNQVREEDMDATRNLLTEVRELVGQMQTRQQDAFHRLKFQEGYTQRNARKISRSGLIMTGLYLAITLFQMYTLRRWLLSTNVLGK